MEFTLPNSGLVAGCSTEFVICYPGYVGNSLLPNVPYLAAALTQPVQFHNPQLGSTALAAVNGASFGSPISPGAWASVFGDFSGVEPAVAASLPYGTSLGGVQVQVNGVPATLLAVSPSHSISRFRRQPQSVARRLRSACRAMVWPREPGR